MNLFTQNQHRCKAFLVFRPTIGLGLWCLTPLSTIVLLYSRSVLLVEETGVLGKKPPICHKSLTNFITRLTVIHTPKVNPSYQDRSPYYKATLTKHAKVHPSYQDRSPYYKATLTKHPKVHPSYQDRSPYYKELKHKVVFDDTLYIEFFCQDICIN